MLKTYYFLYIDRQKYPSFFAEVRATMQSVSYSSHGIRFIDEQTLPANKRSNLNYR